MGLHDAPWAAALLALACNSGGPSAETAGETEVEPDAGSTGEPDGTGEETGEPDEDPPLQFDLQPAVLPRLTERQYRNTMADLLGAALPEPPIEPDTNPYLFYSIGAASTTLSELGVQQYEEAAEELTQLIFADAERREALVGCTPSGASDPCVEDYIAAFGRRAFRRPLTDTELDQWTGLVADLAEPDVWEGVRLATSGILQSPNFLYRVELGEPDPDDGDRLRYTSYEMASRLSYLLWDTMPDDELLDAADDGSLLTADGLREHAERLIASDRARESVGAFFGQYFDLSRLDGVTRSQELYPLYNDLMPQEMRAEVELLVDDIVFRRDVDFRKIYGTTKTFVSNHLATLYGVEAPGATPIAYVPVTLPEDGPRRGLLTTAAFLTMNAHETETSPTARGKYLRERVLCDEVPAPPDDVDLDLSPDDENPTTLRERLEEHRTNPACSGCHAFIDPPGFLFENFDSIGAYRTEDQNGFAIDASGDLDGEPLANATELAPLLQESDKIARCVVKQLYRHAHARLDAEGEEAALDDLAERFTDADHRVQSLLLDFVTHDSFRYLGEGE